MGQNRPRALAAGPQVKDALVLSLWQEHFEDMQLQQEIVIIGQSLCQDSIIKVLDYSLLMDDDIVKKDKDLWVQDCV